MTLNVILAVVLGLTIGFVTGVLFATYISIKENCVIDAEWENVE